MSATTWMYEGVWGILTQWFRVPTGPPEMPYRHASGDGAVESLRPAPAFLTYLKFQYWLFAGLVGGAALAGLIATLIAMPIAGLLLSPLFAGVFVVVTAVAYLAFHLRYDSTWYVLTDRSMRLRRGIWIIQETTITFENIQNVTVNQGPVQRYFGIADVVVQTAGGGAGHGQQVVMTHMGILQGLADAGRVRDLIMSRVKRSRSAGLGDEVHPHSGGAGWTAEHVAVLREIRDRVVALRA